MHTDDPQIPARLAALLSAFGARLRVLVERHCRTQQGLDPDDIEQEARIRLWQALARDRNAVLPASYIQRVALSAVIDAVRRALVRATEPMPEDPFDTGGGFADAEAGPDHRAADAQRLALIRRELSALPERRRAAVELHLQGFGFVEIGKLQGTSAEATRKLVERGLDELKQRLRALGLDDFDE